MDLEALIERVKALFKDVPDITDADVESWLTEAYYTYGIEPADAASTLDADESHLIVLLAQINGARAIAMSTARYFRYRDNEEEVDQSKVSEQYRKLAADLGRAYDVEEARYKRRRREGSGFKIMRRRDRDWGRYR